MEEARIIPARAGFTDLMVEKGGNRADHPRSRGVYPNEGLWTATVTGSSPLARGLHGGSESGQDACRIIPARAGFTVDGWMAEGRDSDHPRSRGVYATPRLLCA